MPSVRAALRLVGILWAAVTASSAAAAPGAPAWKQVYETNQTVYYVSAASFARPGDADVATLIEFKVPQVVGAAQTWSMVSHMKLNCDLKRVMTIDNSFYALPMGAGPVVLTQAANDQWHEPEAGSLGELVWSTGCGKG